ncbi:nitroreductase [Clostridium tertium]|uniref:Nitroreductase n=1 Tax=Clostridium tertium TaxID=1559 RepID=A0A9X3XMA5_9CLOT|nr:ArpU family phage packaging/lysis transcriptional regulator [Clostridium tertium]MDC4241965.1 nitroreductase [Clostridium tertium]
MLINEEKYKKFKRQVEDDLEKYYYYLISIETPGLGQATRWDKVYEKSNTPSDPVSKAAIDDEYKRILVNAIDNVYDRLDEKSKRIIEEYYFKGNIIKAEEVMTELKINKSKYYELKKISLYKFMLGLGYC